MAAAPRMASPSSTTCLTLLPGETAFIPIPGEAAFIPIPGEAAFIPIPGEAAFSFGLRTAVVWIDTSVSTAIARRTPVLGKGAFSLYLGSAGIYSARRCRTELHRKER